MIRAYMLILGLIYAPFSFSDTIYDTAIGVSTGFTQGCTAIANPPLDDQAQQHQDGLTAANGNSNSYYRNFSRTSTVHTSGQYCQNWVTNNYEECDYNFSSGALTNCTSRAVSFKSGWGDITQVPECPPEGSVYNDYSILGQKTDGNDQCYTPDTLSDVDSCDYGSVMAAGTNTASSLCYTKPDDSKCVMQRVDYEGTSFYEQSLEPSSCYSGGYNQFVEDPVQPPTADCIDLGSGSLMCSEQESNVCDPNGTCQTGCGTISYAGSTDFVCFSSDTDSDGLPNYMDPDIDGDGIPNGEDLDPDGDGQDNADYSNTPGGNNTTNITTVNADVDLSELVDEQSDFDRVQDLANIDNKINSYDTIIDTAFNDDAFDFSDELTDSQFADSFAVLSFLGQTTCAANIPIPKTDGEVNVCDVATRVHPYLYLIFGFTTFVYCYVRVVNTIRVA